MMGFGNLRSHRISRVTIQIVEGYHKELSRQVGMRPKLVPGIDAVGMYWPAADLDNRFYCIVVVFWIRRNGVDLPSSSSWIFVAVFDSDSRVDHNEAGFLFGMTQRATVVASLQAGLLFHVDSVVPLGWQKRAVWAFGDCLLHGTTFGVYNGDSSGGEGPKTSSFDVTVLFISVQYRRHPIHSSGQKGKYYESMVSCREPHGVSFFFCLTNEEVAANM
mmetsp:Transcript_44885/g.68646  ORF Transcript_44885/g.68646 Transcript_44885/m.68646 type:complete len:218 (-) Transcript_44885:9-662(-)